MRGTGSALRRFDEEPCFWASVRLAVALWILALATTYLSRGGLYLSSLLYYPDAQVYGCLGLLTALACARRRDSLRLSGEVAFRSMRLRLLFFASDAAAWTGFFQVVLLPVSGFGVIEWVLTLYVVAGSALLAGRDPLTFQPASVAVLGIALFLLKIAVNHLLPVDIYGDMINETVRWILFAVAALFGLKFLADTLSSIGGRAREVSGVRLAGGVLRAAIGALANGAGLVVRLLGSGPFLLAVVGVALVSGLSALLLLGKIEGDLWAAVEPLLKQILTTDRLNVIRSKSWAVSQGAALALFFGYFYWDVTVMDDYFDRVRNRLARRLEEVRPNWSRFRPEIFDLLERADPGWLAQHQTQFGRQLELACLDDGEAVSTQGR